MGNAYGLVVFYNCSCYSISSLVKPEPEKKMSGAFKKMLIHITPID